jgi:hypothetical protein
MRLRSVGAAKRPARARPANPFVIPAGWYRPRTDTRAAFVKRIGREPDEGEEGRLKYIVKYSKQAFRAPINETTLEAGHGMLGYYLKDPSKGLPSKKYVERVIGPRAQAVVHQHIHAYHASHSSFFSKLNPAKLISAAANIVSKVAPFVDMAIKLVPGAGQIYSAAKAAVNIGMSLAKGRPLTDAFIDGALAALPGGDIAKRAARAVISLAKGRSLTGAMLDQVKEQFPGADKAIAVAAGIAHGRKLQDIAIDEVKGLAASQLKGLKMPLPAGVEIPAGMRKGAEYAMGVLHKTELPNGSPLTPAAALAIRKRLSKVQRQGFDRVMSMRALKNFRAGSPHVPRPRPLSLKGATLVTSTGLVRL